MCTSSGVAVAVGTTGNSTQSQSRQCSRQSSQVLQRLWSFQLWKTQISLFYHTTVWTVNDVLGKLYLLLFFATKRYRFLTIFVTIIQILKEFLFLIRYFRYPSYALKKPRLLTTQRTFSSKVLQNKLRFLCNKEASKS